MSEEEQAISIKNPAPAPDQKEKWIDGKRFCFDRDCGKWRYIPKHCPLNINPFDDYTPVRPFKHVEHFNTQIKKLVPQFVDANGIRLKGEGTVNLRAYPTNHQFALRTLKNQSDPKAKQQKQLSNYERAGRLLMDPLKTDEHFKDYFDKHGQPKPQLIFKLLHEITQQIIAQPEVIGNIYRYIHKQATGDHPLTVLKELREVFGAPIQMTQVNIGQQPDTMPKLNIFVREEGVEITQDATTPKEKGFSTGDVIDVIDVVKVEDEEGSDS